MYFKKISTRSFFMSIILSVFISQSVKAEDDQWTIYIEPYAQATTIEGSTAVGRADEADIVVDFDQILENLDSGAMLNVKAIHSSGWGAAINYAYMDLRADKTSENGNNLSATVRQGELQAELIYFQQHGEATLEYLLGVRWWDNDIDLDLSPEVNSNVNKQRINEDWVDYFFGARWVAPINKKWNYAIRGDIGKGGTEFTSSVEAGVQYKLSANGHLSIKYKSTWLNYKDGKPGEKGYFKYDTVTHGPAVAYTYMF
jgi:hypothetical protein